MKQCEFPKCGRGKSRCMCEGDPVTAPTLDAVTHAREAVVLAVTACEQSVGETGTIDEYSRDRKTLEASLDSYAAAVRAECAAKVEHAIDRAINHQHNAYAWTEQDGAWDAYIAPMLRELRAEAQP